ncbi:hypothetical protein ACFQWB_10280 [Paenibacillus thermoaerophilus]|uniref:Uncharacterized protein n=1 Tax=Paenibacillus thermoaerophilus TaxID=1215385 RepID=A0ABW2V7P2_9BACL|nr:hypothetical protein [Paenibacillus thermoaerophilus]TMV18837.1 hypothetical protein FE781_02610 [Paenibacillus thermoaerophilus]
MSDYTFIDGYTKTPGSNLTFEFSPVTLQPQQTLVFWYNNKNRSLQEFNDYYGVSLTESQVVNVSGFQGFANGGDRGVIIKNKQGVEIARASYLSGDTAEDQGVQYKLADSGIDEAILQILAAPTPGSVTSGQVPSSPVILPDMPANLPPVVVHTPVTSGNAANDLVITADIKDPESTVTDSTYANESVTATVFYKLPSDAAYKTVSMVKTSDSGYTGIIPERASRSKTGASRLHPCKNRTAPSKSAKRRSTKRSPKETEIRYASGSRRLTAVLKPRWPLMRTVCARSSKPA